MAKFDYDLFVIGAGSGGVRAARMAAMTGARVAVAEESRIGGTCVIRGCVPKKFMVYASEYKRHFEDAKGYGWSFPRAPVFDWTEFRTARDMEVARLSGIYESNLRKAGCDLVRGRAAFIDAHTLQVVTDEEARGKGGEDRTVTADKVLIATGGRPSLPSDVPGIEHAITSDEAFDLPALPKRMMIVGGGYIAIEFACIFHELGVDITLAYRGTNLLRGFDDDVRSHVAEELKSRGLKVALACQHERIEKRKDGALVSHVLKTKAVETDVVMFATGRKPHTDALGLAEAGVKTKPNGAVEVDEFSKTSARNIWAVGDVTDRIALTPVAIREGAAFAETVFHDRPTAFDHACVPTSVFSQPPVGCVGLTEAQARHAHKHVDVYQSKFRPMKNALAGNPERVLMKLVVDGETDRILGCHIVAPEGPELIQLAAVAVKAGLTKAQWDATCALHPTVAEELVTMRDKFVPSELQAAE